MPLDDARFTRLRTPEPEEKGSSLRVVTLVIWVALALVILVPLALAIDRAIKQAILDGIAGYDRLALQQAGY